PSLRDARDYRKADVGSDHYLVRGERKLKLRNQKQPKLKRLLATKELKDLTNANAFTLELRNRFVLLKETKEIEETWQGLRDATVECMQNSI
uniref:Uncharacterized protein n=1 Tax=Romanomermis culicivorax TaxID=13658 RepID=A0A915I303_ROMCU